MKTYKIKQGGRRNTPLGKSFLELDCPIDGDRLFIPWLDDTTIIRLHRRTPEGGSVVEASVTLQDFREAGVFVSRLPEVEDPELVAFQKAEQLADEEAERAVALLRQKRAERDLNGGL